MEKNESIGRRLDRWNGAIFMGRIGTTVFAVGRGVEQLSVVRQGGAPDYLVIALLSVLALSGILLSSARIWTAYVIPLVISFYISTAFFGAPSIQFSWISVGTVGLSFVGVLATFKRRKLLEEVNAEAKPE